MVTIIMEQVAMNPSHTSLSIKERDLILRNIPSHLSTFAFSNISGTAMNAGLKTGEIERIRRL